MLQQVLIAVAISGVIFFFLQSSEDAKARREGLPPPTVARKAVLFFFVFLVVLVLLHFMGVGVGGSKGKVSGGEKMHAAVMGSSDASWKNDMIERIREDVHVGVAPF